MHACYRRSSYAGCCSAPAAAIAGLIPKFWTIRPLPSRPLACAASLSRRRKKDGQPLRYVGLSGQSMVAILGRESEKRIVLVGKSGYLKPYTDPLSIVSETVICRGEHVLFEARNGEERMDVFLLNLEDESVRKIGSYLTADLLVPVNWQQEEISFVVHSVSGAVLSRYHVEKNTLERVGDSGALSENLPANLKNAVVSKLFHGELCGLPDGCRGRISTGGDRCKGCHPGNLKSTHGASAAADGDKIYYIAENGTLMSWDLETDQKAKIMEGVSQFSLSEDGSKLAVVEKSAAAYKLYVVDIRSGQTLYVDLYKSISHIYLNADGTGLLVNSLQVDQTTQKADTEEPMPFTRSPIKRLVALFASLLCVCLCASCKQQVDTYELSQQLMGLLWNVDYETFSPEQTEKFARRYFEQGYLENFLADPEGETGAAENRANRLKKQAELCVRSGQRAADFRGYRIYCPACADKRHSGFFRPRAPGR